ncbi:hypothetical protein ACSFBI_05260 [Variovorax sp. RB3P1]|uniref:hypothetical protein n=1 Tax=Variovorax sp. RB3P1 TaxID=3443732 RepID=UPI003F483428
MNSKYDPTDVIDDLKAHNVDIDQFEAVLLRMNGGASSQSISEFIYDTVRLNTTKWKYSFNHD